ncbi:MAG: 2-amino-4-hydroxy-6-hydroxymethyldihydropteridine diphosphokinase [Rhodospirillaceae bacterium]|nr:2-amino-4-hydroxy-6-hydroxymethyldihydropteridine diphosphokinase [Rhodospirillaceae bacterium]|tara:strand:+ start:397 stop:885 length:489 start_codon:yes stop_codon:yes gene_type:complete
MIYIGLGANLKYKKNLSLVDSLNLAIEKMSYLSIKVLNKSSFFSSAPVPLTNQPWFVNSVISIETTFAPVELLKNLHSIEKEFGRKRDKKWGPRSLDLDVISYNKIKSISKINLPHPRMHERAFVLYPLKELDKNWIHPISGKSVSQLINELPVGQVIRKIS